MGNFIVMLGDTGLFGIWDAKEEAWTIPPLLSVDSAKTLAETIQHLYNRKHIRNQRRAIENGIMRNANRICSIRAESDLRSGHRN